MRSLVLVLGAASAALGLAGCSTFDAVAKNPSCVVRISGKTTFGGGFPVGEARYSAVCNAVKAEPPPAAPPAPDDVKAPG
jgi:hypothetical protein